MVGSSPKGGVSNVVGTGIIYLTMYMYIVTYTVNLEEIFRERILMMPVLEIFISSWSSPWLLEIPYR